jgi:hypothetical protein
MTKILVEERVDQDQWQHGIPSTSLRPNYQQGKEWPGDGNL